jgi:hypothetical protein
LLSLANESRVCLDEKKIFFKAASLKAVHFEQKSYLEKKICKKNKFVHMGLYLQSFLSNASILCLMFLIVLCLGVKDQQQIFEYIRQNKEFTIDLHSKEFPKKTL